MVTMEDIIIFNELKKRKQYVLSECQKDINLEFERIRLFSMSGIVNQEQL